MTGFVQITLGPCSEDPGPNGVCLAQGGASTINQDPRPNMPALADRDLELILDE